MKKWTIPDLIDLEYFLSLEGTATDASIEQRDRRIFLDAVEPRVAGAPTGSTHFRRSALRLWLEERRSLFSTQEPAAVLPGEVFLESGSLLRILVAAAGIASGVAVSLSLLTYTGKAAVNVTMYLGVLVFLQILGLLVMFRFLFFKTSMGWLRHYSLLYGLLSRVLEKIAARIARSAMTGIKGRQSDEIRSMSGFLRGMYGIYGQVFFWPFFAATQLFGVMFNAGAIGATLIRVFTSDLAFGWQSTLQMSSGVVYALVRALAAPWAWLLGRHAYPSLEQIEGSRMVLKEGLTTLVTGNLVSWWPFLVGAVLCYGLLPRVLLSIAAILGENLALTRVRFTHAGCDRLMLRMCSPGISTAGVPDRSTASGLPGKNPLSREAVYLSYTDAAALVPDDIIGRCTRMELDRQLNVHLGLNLTEILPVTGNIDKDCAVIKAAIQGHGDEERAVVLVQEAWLPPIAETIGLIHEIRTCSGKAMRIALLLIGKPAEGTIFTPVRPVDKVIWDKALDGLADPHLSLAAAGDT